MQRKSTTKIKIAERQKSVAPLPTSSAWCRTLEFTQGGMATGRLGPHGIHPIAPLKSRHPAAWSVTNRFGPPLYFRSRVEPGCLEIGSTIAPESLARSARPPSPRARCTRSIAESAADQPLDAAECMTSRTRDKTSRSRPRMPLSSHIRRSCRDKENEKVSGALGENDEDSETSDAERM